MAEYTALSLFTGGGGMDLAFEEEGFEIKGQVEVDAYCNAILEKHWPGVPRWGNIKRLGGSDFARAGIATVDVVFGGPPCQPYSNAGKRRGKADDRHLWPQMRRIIRMLSPRFVLFENVPGIVRLVLDDVLADLESAGYTAIPFIVPACGVGATHRRERVFVVAYTQDGGETKLSAIAGRESAVVGTCPGAGGGTIGGNPATGIPFDGGTATGSVADVEFANRNGWLAWRPEQSVWQRHSPFSLPGFVADSDHAQRLGTHDQVCPGRHTADVGSEVMADALRAGLEVWQGVRGDDLEECQAAERSSRDALSDPDRQSSDGSAIARAECGDGAVESGVGRATARLSRRLDRDRWPARPGEAQHDWEAPRTATNVPYRTSRLKVLGNACVPQQVAPFAKAIRLTLESWDVNHG